MVPVPDSPAERLARVLSRLALASALVAAGWLLWPRPLGDAFFPAWVAFGATLAAVRAAATWTRRRAVIWMAAVLLVGLSIVGMRSICFLIAPGALLLLATGLVLQAGGVGGTPPPAEPPSARESIGRTLGGVAAIGVGVWLAYEGTIVRELFSRGVPGRRRLAPSP